jgi:TetR/AcrR family transcriptional repressor of nem operon
MRYSKTHKQNSRLRILKSAASAFRKKGIDGVGVADIMKKARLTHGGFYAHFSSKEELVAETFSPAFSVSYLALAFQERKPASVLELAEIYLSEYHRDHPGEGCPAAALAGEVHRHSGKIKKTFTAKMSVMLALIERVLPPGGTTGTQKKQAMAIFSVMMGAMQLARASDNRTLSRAFLKAGIEAACTLAQR